MAVKKPVVEICCIQNRKEADIAIQTGASAVGLASEMPSVPEQVVHLMEAINRFPANPDSR